jgi:hypothetical protein
MVTSSMYVGKDLELLIKHKPNVGEIATAAVDTVSATVQTNLHLAD